MFPNPFWIQRWSTRASVLGAGLLAAFAFPHALVSLAAQETASENGQVFFACYVKGSGVTYRVNPPDHPGEDKGLPNGCKSKNHTLFSWNQAGGAGPEGPAGAEGLSCWDRNGNGTPDEEEDVNRDGLVNAMDCQGPPGPAGTYECRPPGVHPSGVASQEMGGFGLSHVPFRPAMLESRESVGASSAAFFSDPYLGQMMLVPYNFAPRGWAFAHGQLLPIAQNSALFSLLGTMYGGDGRTTFQLPDLRGLEPVCGMNWVIALVGVFPSRS